MDTLLLEKNNQLFQLDPELKQILTETAQTIRHLSIDAVQKAESGHPGMPMGTAEIGSYLYGHFLKHNPKSPKWLNRDRFILSAGHGSMLLYSCLHLSGFDLSLDDLKNFRQLHSKTPGHPEYPMTCGVETTTGPLGQGIGVAVGQALGLKILNQRFNHSKNKLFDSKVVALVGDGCIIEGISSEVSSLAGHLKIDNLIVIYDANKVTLDGPLSDSCSEDTPARYRSYGWDVYEVDGHNLDEIHSVLTQIRHHQTRPCLVVAHTIIGKGSPNKAGSFKVHGSPLGVEEVKATKESLKLPLEDFFIPESVKSFFKEKLLNDQVDENNWIKIFEDWKKENPQHISTFNQMLGSPFSKNLEEKLNTFSIKGPIAGRKASQEVINHLIADLPQLYGGSADLSCSDLTLLKQFPTLTPGNFSGRNIKYGEREFGMATIATGLFQTQMIIPFIGTFLTFSDYMRNAIRLAALQNIQVIYQFTHDSIFLGEDGATHQPVEHVASLRAIPRLQVIRPADGNEVKMAWLAALKYQGPTALILSRQNLPDLAGTHVAFVDGLGRGAYIIKKEKIKPDYTLIATGSELSLALEVADSLEKLGKDVRVISMPCWELFEQQNTQYKAHLFSGDLGIRVSIEAASSFGWHKYIGIEGIAVAIDDFGASAPASALAEEFGFTVESIIKKIL